MANTYTQLHTHFVFAVKYREALIAPEWKEELFKYITGIVQHYKHKLLAINAMPDHIHILVGMRPEQSVSDLMKEVKQASSTWINEHRLTKKRFRWQNGYGAFVYHKSLVPTFIRYIRNQDEHHREVSFYKEYRRLLIEHEVDFDENYLFHTPKDHDLFPD
jgi:REP element-mobilizing transposase RayT